MFHSWLGCRNVRLSVIYWQCSWACPEFEKTNLIFLNSIVAQSASFHTLHCSCHTTTVKWCWLSNYCLSCVRSLASSLSSSKRVLLHTELARQFCNGRHLPSFHHWLPTTVELVDCRIWLEMQHRLYETNVQDVDEMKQHISIPMSQIKACPLTQ